MHKVFGIPPIRAEFHRAQCVEAIDACIFTLQERFDQKIYSVLMKIETVFISAVNGRIF